MTDPGDQLLDGFRTLTALLGAARQDAADTGPEAGVDPGTRCPVTVLTGLLGSGKTTVLRRLLEGDHGLALTAIVNDLGSINIDGPLLADATPHAADGPAARLELTNGCACCAGADDLGSTLTAVRTAEPGPDAVVIEASGAADAVAVAATIEGDDALRLDGVVCVVDADAFGRQLAHPVLGPLARRQLAASHLVLLSKTDLVDDVGLAEVRDAVAELAPGRRLLPTDHGHLDPAVLLTAALHGAAPASATRQHHLDLVTRAVTLPPDRRFDEARLGAWLEQGDHGLIRAKGWLPSIEGRRLELQLVGRRWSLSPADDADATGTELVLIADGANTLDAAEERLHRLSRIGPD